MRRLVIPMLLAACSSDDPKGMLADAAVDASPDAPPDAPCETVLFKGGTDPAAQGWTVYALQPATLTNGADDVELATSTSGRTGGQLLLARPDAVDPSLPFAIEIVLRVDKVNPHNPLDAAVAILGSLSSQVGNTDERSEMIYIDPTAIGFADDKPNTSAALALVDSLFHTYVLAVDAAHTATFSVDGVPKLTRANYATNGTIAIGDQSNDPGLDATMRLRSVTKLCAR